MAYNGFIDGWTAPWHRTDEEKGAHREAVASFVKMPSFGNIAEADRPKKVVLNSVWNHADVVKALGFKFPRIHQITGSCVWAGAMNAFFTRAALDAVILKQPERIGIPFGLNNYGRSRRRAGMVFPGSGSLGSTMAASLKEDGVVFADSLPGLPQWSNDDGIVYGGSTELKWSITAPITSDLDSLAKQHLITGVAELKTVQDLIDAIQVAKCPVTFACSKYVNDGRIDGSGTDTVVLGDFDSRGGHQTSIQGYWDHPKFGPLFKYQNNWPASVYPTDPDTETGTPCAVWVPADSIAKIMDSGDSEAYALGGYNGFEAQTFSW